MNEMKKLITTELEKFGIICVTTDVFVQRCHKDCIIADIDNRLVIYMSIKGVVVRINYKFTNDTSALGLYYSVTLRKKVTTTKKEGKIYSGAFFPTTTDKATDLNMTFQKEISLRSFLDNIDEVFELADMWKD